VLDEWIDRNGTYDLALRALYQALVESKGNPQTAKVQAARRAERLAFEQLPPDRRTIIVIVGEAARGGLTQAVVAIEDARGRIEDALGEGAIAPGASTPPEATGAPPQSPGVGGSTEPAATPQAVESGVPLP
jgi:hypothetical protein